MNPGFFGNFRILIAHSAANIVNQGLLQTAKHLGHKRAEPR